MFTHTVNQKIYLTMDIKLSGFVFRILPDYYRKVLTKSAKTSLCDGMGVHQCPLHG